MNAIDANVFVYALVPDESGKPQRAEDLIEKLTPSDTLIVWRVACEVGSVLARMRRTGRADDAAFDAFRSLREMFPLAMPTERVLDEGTRIHREHQVSYWDAMLLAACAEAGVTRLYSEDLQSAPKISGIEIVNPFA